MDDQVVDIQVELMSKEEFEGVVREVLDSLPAEFRKHLDNLLIVVEDKPSDEQRRLIHLRRHALLYGLYQGVPLITPGRENMVRPPDRISIFRNSMLASYSDIDGIRSQIRSTVLHEIGHYFGMTEKQLRSLSKKYS